MNPGQRGRSTITQHNGEGKKLVLCINWSCETHKQEQISNRHYIKSIRPIPLKLSALGSTLVARLKKHNLVTGPENTDIVRWLARVQCTSSISRSLLDSSCLAARGKFCQTSNRHYIKSIAPMPLKLSALGSTLVARLKKHNLVTGPENTDIV